MDTTAKDIKPKRPSVGVRVVMYNEKGEILVGLRPENGKLGLPGGYLEFLEEWNECAARETYEELDLRLDPAKDFEFLCCINGANKKDKFHFVNIFMLCQFPKDQKIVNKEPEKCPEWIWMSLDDMAKQLDSLYYGLHLLIRDHLHILKPKVAPRQAL